MNFRAAIIQRGPEERCRIVTELIALHEMGDTLASTELKPENLRQRAVLVRRRNVQTQALKQELGVGPYDATIELIAEAGDAPWDDQCNQASQQREVGLKTALTELAREPRQFVDDIGRLHERTPTIY